MPTDNGASVTGFTFVYYGIVARGAFKNLTFSRSRPRLVRADWRRVATEPRACSLPAPANHVRATLMGLIAIVSCRIDAGGPQFCSPLFG